MYVSQEVRQADFSLGSQFREQFAHAIFPDPAAILPTGSLERACPVLWHNLSPDGFWKGIFSRTAPRRATVRCGAQAGLVAVDNAENLKAAACGAVPRGQTSQEVKCKKQDSTENELTNRITRRERAETAEEMDQEQIKKSEGMVKRAVQDTVFMFIDCGADEQEMMKNGMMNC